MIKLILGVVIVSMIVLGGFLALDPNVKKGTDSNTTLVDDSTHSYSIEGEVVKPGTYALKDGSKFEDLVVAAGGLTNNGDIRCYFEDLSIESGVTYYVGGVYNVNDVCAQSPIEKVSLNTGDYTELTGITGITSSIANSIISYRSEIGTYTYLEQLLDVYGIGNATYKKIRNYVYLHE